MSKQTFAPGTRVRCVYKGHYRSNQTGTMLVSDDRDFGFPIMWDNDNSIGRLWSSETSFEVISNAPPIPINQLNQLNIDPYNGGVQL